MAAKRQRLPQRGSQCSGQHALLIGQVPFSLTQQGLPAARLQQLLADTFEVLQKCGVHHRALLNRVIKGQSPGHIMVKLAIPDILSGQSLAPILGGQERQLPRLSHQVKKIALTGSNPKPKCSGQHQRRPAIILGRLLAGFGTQFFRGGCRKVLQDQYQAFPLMGILFVCAHNVFFGNLVL